MLTNEHIAFYSTAATVMPVLTLGSVLAVAALARTASRSLDDLSTAIQSGLRQFVERELQPLQTKPVGRLILAIELASLNFAFGRIGRRLVAPLLFVAFLLPTIGEISALAALAEGHAGSSSETLVWVGLAASAVLALMPILEVLLLLSRPVDAFRSALRQTVLARKSQPQIPVQDEHSHPC